MKSLILKKRVWHTKEMFQVTAAIYNTIAYLSTIQFKVALHFLYYIILLYLLLIIINNYNLLLL